jgi:transglutaminase-like putative cysteine protease
MPYTPSKEDISFHYWDFIKYLMGGVLQGMVGVIIRQPEVIYRDNLPTLVARLKKGTLPGKRPKQDNDGPTYYVGITQEEIDAVTDEDIKKATYTDKLRKPTKGFLVNSRPIVALAKKLGAFDESLPRSEYAQRVFNFVKDNIKPAYGAYQESLQVLRSGEGACVDQSPLVASLARAGGIPALAVVIRGHPTDPMIQMVESIGDTLFTNVFNMFGFLGGVHGSVMLWLDGRWVISDPTFGDGLLAAMGYQVTDLGRDLGDCGITKEHPDILTPYNKAHLILHDPHGDHDPEVCRENK